MLRSSQFFRTSYFLMKNPDSSLSVSQPEAIYYNKMKIMDYFSGNKLLIVLLFVAVPVFSGCLWDQRVLPDPVSNVSFSRDLQPLFNSKCAISACHEGGSIPLNLSATVAYDELISGNYIDTASPAGSKLYVKISPGESMEQYANNSDRAKVLKWIEEGAMNN